MGLSCAVQQSAHLLSLAGSPCCVNCPFTLPSQTPQFPTFLCPQTYDVSRTTVTRTNYEEDFATAFKLLSMQGATFDNEKYL